MLSPSQVEKQELYNLKISRQLTSSLLRVLCLKHSSMKHSYVAWRRYNFEGIRPVLHSPNPYEARISVNYVLPGRNCAKKTNSLTRSPEWKISKTLIKGHCFCLMPDGIEQLRGNISLPGTSKNHLIGKKINGISKFTVPSKCHLKQAHLTHHDEFPSIFLSLGQLYSSSCCSTRWYSHLHGERQVFIVNRETWCPWQGILKKV